MSSLFPLPSPVLPDFQSLLVTGPFHASALIHLCLTHLSDKSPHTRIVVFSPTRQELSSSILELNDDWLNECGGYGAVAHVLSRVDIHYIPSPLHLKFMLSMLRVPDTQEHLAHPPKATLDSPPSLLVLHDLSTYFLNSDSSKQPTLPAYLSLVAYAFSCAVSLGQNSNNASALVLMDSRLYDLKLPIIPRPIAMPIPADCEEETGSYKKEEVIQSVRRYFEWAAIFDRPTEPASTTAAEHSPSNAQSLEPMPAFTHRLHLLRNSSFSRHSDNQDIVWEWNQVKGESRGYSERKCTQFSWVGRDDFERSE